MFALTKATITSPGFTLPKFLNSSITNVPNNGFYVLAKHLIVNVYILLKHSLVLISLKVKGITDRYCISKKCLSGHSVCIFEKVVDTPIDLGQYCCKYVAYFHGINGTFGRSFWLSIIASHEIGLVILPAKHRRVHGA